MIIQICGAVLLVVCVICGTWHWTAIRREKLITERMERERIAYAAQKAFENESLKLYEDERQRREAAETKVGILQHQLKRAREQMATVIIKEVK